MDITQSDDPSVPDSDPVDTAAPEPKASKAGGGLGAIMAAMSGGTPVTSTRVPALPGGGALSSMLMSTMSQGADPEMKNNAWVAGALAPTHGGGFSESLSNAYGGLTKAQEKEAELKAQYMPHVVQALMSSQMQQYKMQQDQFKLNKEMLGTMTGSLAGMLSDPDNLNKQSAVARIGSLVQQGIVPADFAINFAQNLPDDPATLKKFILGNDISQQDAAGRVKSVTPDIKTITSGNKTDFANTNSTAGPVGTVAPALPINLTPEQALPKEVKTAAGPALINMQTGDAAMVGTPQAQQVAAQAAARSAASSGATPPPAMSPTGSQGQDPTVASNPGASAGPGPVPVSQSAPPGQGPAAPATPFGQLSAQQKYQQDEAPKAFAKYEDGVNSKVQFYQTLMPKLAEMRDLFAATKAGASRPEFVKVAGVANDLLTTFGMDPARAKSLTDKIAGGDLSAAREMQKIAIQTVIPQLKADAGPNARLLLAEFTSTLKATPGVDMDPKAAENMYNAVTKDYMLSRKQQDFINGKKSIPGYDISQIPNEWNKEVVKSGGISPQITSNTFKGTQQNGPSQTYDVGTTSKGQPAYRPKGATKWTFGSPPK